MNTSATPEWLEDNGESSGTAGTGVDPFQGVSLEDKNDDAVEKESSSRSRVACSGSTIALWVLSLGFIGLFAYGAAANANDPDALQWIIFYALNAVVPAMFLLYSVCCFPIVVIYFFSAVTAIWSIVYIVIASLNLKNAPPEDDTVDNGVFSERSEYIFELAGASLALFSSLYHVCTAKFCVTKKSVKEEDDAKEAE